MNSPSDEIAVITGAGSGFGSALADRFSRAGMAVAAIDIDREQAEKTAQRLRDSGGRAQAYQADISDRMQMEAVAATLRDDLGCPTVVCANAAVVQFGAIEALSCHDWQWVLNVNVMGTVNTVAAFLPSLRGKAGKRRIAITSSASALAPSVRLAAYIASKAAVTAYAEILRMELASEGIGVSVIFPSAMPTRQHETSARARPAKLGSARLLREDVDAMKAGYSGNVGASLKSPEYASRHVVDAILEDQKFVITHGDVLAEMTARFDELRASHHRAQA